MNTLSAPTNIITNAGDITALFCGALNWLFWGLIVLSIAMFLIGGYLYTTSGGDAEKVGKATKTLTYAAIGVVVALVASGVPYFIGSFLNGNTALFQNACGALPYVTHSIKYGASVN